MLSFVLASNSPRRAALLSEAGFQFEIVPSCVEEKFDPALTLREVTLWNAIRKAMAVAQTYPDSVVLAADTLVALHDQILGKPADLVDAARMLQRLSGRTHEVCSAVMVYQQVSGRSAVFCDVSSVRFHRLNKLIIESYFAKVNPLDKAGAYAAQGRGADIIAKITGSFTNVVGLPMEKTIAALAKFGVHPKQARPASVTRQAARAESLK